MDNTDIPAENTRLMQESMHHQHGFTLIELLISLVIGATLVLIAGNMFVGTLKTNASISGQTELHESSYFISMTVNRHLSQAGFRRLEPDSIQRVQSFPVPDKTAFFKAVSGAWDAGQYVKFDAGKLAIRFGGASVATTAPDSSMVECDGSTIAYDAVGIMEFSIENQQLVCKSSGITEVLAGDVNGAVVEALAVNFGIDDNNDSSTDRIVTGASATTSDLMNVVSIEFRLLLASVDSVTANSVGYEFNGSTYMFSDNRSRLENVSFVALRN